MKTKVIFAGVVAALVAGTTMKLFSNKNTVRANVYQLDPEKRALVQADTAKIQSFEKDFTYTGTFTPLREVMIVPHVQGEVKGIYFNEGDVVVQGKKLVQIDDELLQAQYMSAEANYETAKRNLSRYENASLAGGVSPLQLDNYRLNLKNAESQIKQLLKQIRLCKIEAPFPGTITYKDVEFGSVVGTGPVARITDLSQLKLEISVPEKEIGIFREGEWIDISTDVHPGKTLKGQIGYVAQRADDAHNYTVKIFVRNTEALALKAGMYGTASVHTDLKTESIVIPRAALLGSAKNPQVFVIEGNEVKLKSIRAGAGNGESVDVVEGIESGEVIVIAGQINLADGSKVEIAKQLN